MITLFTGTPGHGKTLLAVTRLKAAREADDARPLYVSGIRDLKIDHAVLEGPDWTKCPDGALIVIDEAQQSFPIRRSGDVPHYVQQLAVHRHRGIDLWLITQHPSLIDSFARKLIDKHVHVHRVAGGEMATVFEWGEVQDDPRSMSAREVSESHVWRYPPSSYGLYASAVMHTAKFKMPKKVIALAAAVVLLAVCVAFMWSWIEGRKETGEVLGVAQIDRMPQPNAAPGPLAARAEQKRMTAEEWVAHYTPRVPHRPESAPAYDRAMASAQPPRLACVDIENGLDCRCYTEQATFWQGIPVDTCRRLARGGIYHPGG